MQSANIGKRSQKENSAKRPAHSIQSSSDRFSFRTKETDQDKRVKRYLDDWLVNKFFLRATWHLFIDNKLKRHIKRLGQVKPESDTSARPADLTEQVSTIESAVIEQAPVLSSLINNKSRQASFAIP